MAIQWAIYDDKGRQILDTATFISYSYNTQSKVMSAPIENGSFAQYNKVTTASLLKLSLAFAGNSDELDSMLTKLEEEKVNVSKLIVLSPEKSYKNYTLEAFNYSHSALDGVYIFDLDFREIHEVGDYYNTLALPLESISNPSDASTLDRGRVQLGEMSAELSATLV